MSYSFKTDTMSSSDYIKKKRAVTNYSYFQKKTANQTKSITDYKGMTYFNLDTFAYLYKNKIVFNADNLGNCDKITFKNNIQSLIENELKNLGFISPHVNIKSINNRYELFIYFYYKTLLNKNEDTIDIFSKLDQICQLSENNINIPELNPLRISYVSPLFIPEYYLSNTRDYNMLFDIALAKSIILPDETSTGSINEAIFYKVTKPYKSNYGYFDRAYIYYGNKYEPYENFTGQSFLNKNTAFYKCNNTIYDSMIKDNRIQILNKKQSFYHLTNLTI